METPEKSFFYLGEFGKVTLFHLLFYILKDYLN